jgi:uncharacterized protein YigE (DUF2233 family)
MKACSITTVWLVLCLILRWGAPPAWAAKAEEVTFQGGQYMTYWVDLETDELALCWKDVKGKGLGSFSRLREHLGPRGQEVRFAINAGIFSSEGLLSPEYIPLGLHVENSRALRPLNLGNLADGQYNFYLKPNGVFYVAGNKPGILESEVYAKQSVRPSLACQSGPLLLTNGAIHPAFRPDSTNFHGRTGVGVTKDNKVVFAISKLRVRFYDFAQLFKDKLRCESALYLDGDICAIYLPELGLKEDALTSYAAMFAVLPKPKPSPPAPGLK